MIWPFNRYHVATSVDWNELNWQNCLRLGQLCSDGRGQVGLRHADQWKKEACVAIKHDFLA